ncbi:MAG: TetR/AcrR family transcriptional regulator, partial [Steroidobacteraceae bacterium]
APNTYRLLTENIWGVWLNWLRMTQIESPFARTPEKQALHEGVIHFWSLCQPWLEPRYAQQLLEAFEKELQVRPNSRDRQPSRGRTTTKHRETPKA